MGKNYGGWRIEGGGLRVEAEEDGGGGRKGVVWVDAWVYVDLK